MKKLMMVMAALFAAVTTFAAPPSTPTGLSVVTNTAAGPTLSWNAVSGIGITYNIYQDGSLLGNNGATTVQVSGLVPGTSYGFGVQAKNINEELSAISAYVTLTAQGETPVGTLPLTTKGDLLSYDGTDLTRLGVGTDGQVLTADSAETSGIKWATAAAGNIGLELVETKSPNASGPETFSGLVVGTRYRIVFDVVIAVPEILKLYFNGMIGTGGAYWAGNFTDEGGVVSPSGGTASSYIPLGGQVGTNKTTSGSFEFRIQQGTNYKVNISPIDTMYTDDGVGEGTMFDYRTSGKFIDTNSSTIESVTIDVGNMTGKIMLYKYNE